VRGSLPLLERIEDRQQHTFAICQNVIVPKWQNSITLVREMSVAPIISLALQMLSAVNFDDEISVAAHEVDNKGADCFLTDEFESSQTAVAQREPELAFGVGLLTAQSAFDTHLPAIRPAHLPLTRRAMARQRRA
jgi:hypothetical protein